MSNYTYCCTLSTFGLEREQFNDVTSDMVNDGIDLQFMERDLAGKIIVGKNDVDDVALEGVLRGMFAGIAENIYADEDISLAECLVNELKNVGGILSVAESLTGGLISSEICSVDGASEVFYEGLVTYNIGSKVRRLHVPARLIEENTAVDSKVAAEMLKGLLANKEINYGIATTGYASDMGELTGTAYIAYGTNDVSRVDKVTFEGDRNEVRAKVSNYAMFKLIKLIRENDKKY